MQRFSLIFLLFAVLGNHSAFAQTTSEKRFQYDSFSIEPLALFFGPGSVEGLAARADLNFRAGRKRISLAYNVGTETAVFGGADSFYAFDALYGYNFELLQWLALDLQAGVGTFRYNYSSGGGFNINFNYQLNMKAQPKSVIDKVNKTVIALPIVAKMRFRTGPRFSLGLQVGYNINASANIFTTGIILQWNKRR